MKPLSEETNQSIKQGDEGGKSKKSYLLRGEMAKRLRTTSLVSVPHQMGDKKTVGLLGSAKKNWSLHRPFDWFGRKTIDKKN